MIEQTALRFVGTSGDDLLGAELIDLVTERVACQVDAAGRAEVLAQLVGCTLDALRWRLEPYGDQAEEDGVAAILTAVREHQLRMRTRPLQQS